MIEPFDENTLAKTWKAEPFDEFLPRPGFLSDYILSTRKMLTPSFLTFWAGIFLLSIVVRRRAFVKWFPRPLYPNFYIIVVAPPKICAKTESVLYGIDVVKKVPDFIRDPLLRTQITPNVFAGDATAPALDKLLPPQEMPVSTPEGVKIVKKGSQLGLVATELATFLGKAKFNSGLIATLTSLYDCKDSDDHITVSRGLMHLEDIFFSFFAATTEDDLKTALPEEAFGEGFMSRVILAMQLKPTKVNPMPEAIVGGPSIADLAQRLAYVAVRARGEYSLDEAAYANYADWYYTYNDMLLKKLDSKEGKMYPRLDIHLLKLSLLLKLQRYDNTDNIIREADLEEAKRILNVTYDASKDALFDVGGNDFTKIYAKIKRLITEGPIKRRRLLQRLSPYGISAAQVNEMLSHFNQEGVLKITLDGKRQDRYTTRGDETYEYHNTRVQVPR